MAFLTARFWRMAGFLAFFLLKKADLGAQLNFYYGNFHAHSSYSDGNQDNGGWTPAQDFAFAEQSLHFDFLGISDHNHSSVGMTLANYHAGVGQAVAATSADFLALYGMEWGLSSNTNGHVLIYGIDSLIGWQAGVYDIFNAQANYAGLWVKINARPASLLTLAHPQTGDFLNLEGTAYSAVADQAISGLSIRSGYAFSSTTNYSDGPATLYELYFQTLLAKGYRVAPSIDHDNHNTTFGRTLPGRTVVLAPALTKSAILAAIKNMHYYASDDWNAQVTFTISGLAMGDEATVAGNPAISVSVADADGEGVSSIQIWSGTPGSGAAATVLTSNMGSTSLSFTHTIATGETRYYYAKIKQNDNDYIWTAPIWATKAQVIPVELTDLKASAEPTGVRLDWSAASESSLEGYAIERSLDGSAFEKIGFEAAKGQPDYAFFDQNPPRGLLFYRLRSVDLDGSAEVSPIVAAHFERRAFALLSLSPNPADGLAELRFSSIDEDETLTWRLFDADGRGVKSGTFESKKGGNALQIEVGDLCAGLYHVLVGRAGQAFLEVKLVRV